MPNYDIVVFAGDHCGPEVSFPENSQGLTNLTGVRRQVTREALKVNAVYKVGRYKHQLTNFQVLRVIENESSNIQFKFSEQMLGGVSSLTRTRTRLHSLYALTDIILGFN